MYRLKSRIDLISARRAYSAAFSSQSLKILVCAGTGCVAGGSLDIYARLKELIDEKGLYCQVELDHEHHSHGHDGCDSSNVKTVGLKKSGCHGFCEMGPLVRIEPYGYLYTKVKLEDCEEIVEKTVMNGEIVERLSYHKDGVSFPVRRIYHSIKSRPVSCWSTAAISTPPRFPSTLRSAAIPPLKRCFSI